MQSTWALVNSLKTVPWFVQFDLKKKLKKRKRSKIGKNSQGRLKAAVDESKVRCWMWPAIVSTIAAHKKRYPCFHKKEPQKCGYIFILKIFVKE